MDKAIERQIRDRSALPMIKSITHNIFEYSAPRNFRRQTLEGVNRGFFDICKHRELAWQTATCADVASRLRALNPLPTSAEAPVLDTRGGAL